MTSNPDAIRQVMTLSASLSDASLTSPAALPALREHLRRYPLADILQTELARVGTLPALQTFHSVTGYLTHVQRAFAGDLFWLNADTVTAAEDAADDIPEDVTLADVVHDGDPGLHALMVFARPMTDIYFAAEAADPLHGLTTFFDATLLSIDASAAFTYSFRYIPTDPDHFSPHEASFLGDLPASLPAPSGWWPAGALGLWRPNEPIGMTFTERGLSMPAQTPEMIAAYQSKKRRRLAALYAIARDQRVFTQTPVTLPRAERRRLTREHPNANPNPDVHVISIGDPPEQQRQPSSPSPDGPARRGHLVRAHTRLQPYGPGRTLRRLRVIPAHWRGNMDDRIDSDRVYSVARTVISAAGQQPPPDTDST